MQVHVTPATLEDEALDAWDALQEDAQAGTTTLELVLAAGEYARFRLKFGSEDDTRPIHLVIRGAAGAQVVFQALYLRARCQSVHLESLIVEKSNDDLPILDVRVAETLTIERCVFHHNVMRGKPGGRLFEFGADGKAPTLLIGRCWFIANRGIAQTMLMALRDDDSGFTHVTFEETAFIANEIPVLIVPQSTPEITFDRCILIAPAAQIVLAINDTDTQMSMRDSLLLGDTIERVISRWSPDEPTPHAFQPLHFQRSGLYLRAQINDPQHSDITDTDYKVLTPALDAHMLTLVPAWIEQATALQAPDLPTLRADLERSAES